MFSRQLETINEFVTAGFEVICHLKYGGRVLYSRRKSRCEPMKLDNQCVNKNKQKKMDHT